MYLLFVILLQFVSYMYRIYDLSILYDFHQKKKKKSGAPRRVSAALLSPPNYLGVRSRGLLF